MNWGVVPIPTMGGNVPGPFVGVHGFFLGNYGQQDAGTEFLLEYVATAETMINLFEETYRPPAHLAAYAAVADDVTEAFMDSAAAGEPMPNIPEMGVVWGPLMDALDAVRTGTLPAQEAMEWAAQAVRDALGG